MKIKVEKLDNNFVATQDFGDDLGWLGEIGTGKTEQEATDDLLNRVKGEIEMKNISIDNGYSTCTVKEAIQKVDWDVIVNFMDDEIRERVHMEIAPCTEEEFLTRYLELAEHDLVIG